MFNSVNSEKYQGLFIDIMETLFSDKDNRENTLEYYKNHNYKGITKEAYIYTIKKADNFTVKISQVPDGPSSYISKSKGKTRIKKIEINRENPKYEAIQKKYLYLGKASKNNNRLKTYIKFGYEKGSTTIKHDGGDTLWFIENNKQLLATYTTIQEIKKNKPELYDKAIDIQSDTTNLYKKRTGKDISQTQNQLEVIIETGLNVLHKLSYDYFPFANSEKDKSIIEHRNLWLEYWQNNIK